MSSSITPEPGTVAAAAVPASMSRPPLGRRQKRMGPAPFASFEDLSDELDSPEDKQTSVVRLPGIREDVQPSTFLEESTPPSTAMSTTTTPQGSSTSTTALSLQAPSTPRIDISRASSSSHHEDSRDSTPERELFEGVSGGATAKLGLAFKEEGALDLRSSTEELDFQDPTIKDKPKPRPSSPLQFRFDDPQQCHQRKDSQSSEIGLLSISGRTSRLSSIGSQGSDHSRMSNTSHLSIISGRSGISRSPSPHKMLLETSFCGSKLSLTGTSEPQVSGTKVDSEVLEQVLLSRKHDPTEAVLAEGITIADTKKNTQTIPKISIAPEKPARLLDRDNKPSCSSTSSSGQVLVPGKTIIAESGVEYTFIPLKGPLPMEERKDHIVSGKSRRTEAKSTTRNKGAKSKEREKTQKQANTTVSTRKEEEPQYIRIKLKPDHMYDDNEITTDSSYGDVQKPISLNLKTNPVVNDRVIVKVSRSESARRATPPSSASPKLPRSNVLRETNVGSRTPSPSLSRRSSFASLFRSKEAIMSPESPTAPGKRKSLTSMLKEAGRDRSSSRSKSKERASTTSTAPSSTESIDSARSKQSKSVFSIFKPRKHKSSKSSESPMDVSSPEPPLPNIEAIANVEFTFDPEKQQSSTMKKPGYQEAPLDGDSIRIPLHSPTDYENRIVLQDVKSSSQDSQETVIERTIVVEEVAVVEAVPRSCENRPSIQHRQSSTSSENIVFSTKLGSNNEIFTTKLPKEKHLKKFMEGTSAEKENNDKPPSVVCNNVCVQVVKEDAHYRDDKDDKESEKADVENGASSRNSVISAQEDHNSSESERESATEYLKKKGEMEKLVLEREEVNDHERKGLGLVAQDDSFDDELPYVPTTLPIERSVAVPIVPIKQRSTFEMKTCPIERPRSTTPINPSCLEDYCEDVMSAIASGAMDTSTKSRGAAIEKLKISLPKEDSVDRTHNRLKSPRRVPTTNTWSEFAEKGISTQRKSSLTGMQEAVAVPVAEPPPLPPRGAPKDWINFEEIPEKRKPPKRIQTIPSRGIIEVPEVLLQQHQQDNVVYSYVNPEDCKCECHEIGSRLQEKQPPEDEVPLLDDEAEDGGAARPTSDHVDRIKVDVSSDRRSVVSDSSLDYSASVDTVEVTAQEPPELKKPFTMDLGVSSNRSSVISQDEPQTPESGSTNAFPHHHAQS